MILCVCWIWSYLGGKNSVVVGTCPGNPTCVVQHNTAQRTRPKPPTDLISIGKAVSRLYDAQLLSLSRKQKVSHSAEK
jgi:hypothetical protein